jgi:ribosomal protein S18 acetylase RimI-like enzyme
MDGLIERIWVTYLEATAPPAHVPDLPDGCSLAREAMDYSAYMALYRDVGGPWGWDTRLQSSPDALISLLKSRASANYVLREATKAVGFCEFERQAQGEVELKHFGLVPSHFGRGLGLPLLLNAVALEWADKPKRIWLHTDECDHPAAIGTYKRAGFSIFDRRLEDPGPL